MKIKLKSLKDFFSHIILRKIKIGKENEEGKEAKSSKLNSKYLPRT